VNCMREGNGFLAFNYFGRVLTVLILTTVMLVGAAQAAAGADTIRIVVDGQPINSSPAPFIQKGRTLVPVRLVSETLGAQVDWHKEDKTVTIVKADKDVKLRIDNRLVDYDRGNEFGVTDVSPEIFNGRTFVPLRLVSNALGVAVEWDNDSRTVFVDSDGVAAITPFFEMDIQTVQPGQTIPGITQLAVIFKNDDPSGAAEVKYLLLDPETGRGPVIARGDDINAAYQWLPDQLHSGSRVLAAVINDKNGRFLAGSVVPVQVAVSPWVALTGLQSGQDIVDSVSFKADLNFVAEYVRYEITNQVTGNVITTGEADPQGAYSWTPQLTDNGKTIVRAFAYDRYGNAHESEPVAINVNVKRQLTLRGIAPGASVERPDTLYLSRNFAISQVDYLVKNVETGKEEILASQKGYASYRWFPVPQQVGTWELTARVKDDAGNVFTSNSIKVKVPGTPLLLLKTVGPEEVLTGTTKLKCETNVPLNDITYYLIDSQTGAKRVIASGNDVTAEYSWTPQEEDEGQWRIQAEAVTAEGKKLITEAVPIRVYLGKTYQSRPVIEKSKFLDFAANLAKESREKTGMSAALQTAQAILETGWGQYTPVDKYTGQMSYNLFGIKGKGSAGSVISNTWEEYNGNKFRVDAAFRAYANAGQSWTDHKKLLLSASRYQPFREVMYDGTLGAWALKRAGYATDSQYPLKLMRIIKLYDLHLLDEEGI